MTNELSLFGARMPGSLHSVVFLLRNLNPFRLEVTIAFQSRLDFFLLSIFRTGYAHDANERRIQLNLFRTCFAGDLGRELRVIFALAPSRSEPHAPFMTIKHAPRRGDVKVNENRPRFLQPHENR